MYTNPHAAFDAGLGFSWRQGDTLQLNGDLLIHTNSLTKTADGFLPLYIGGGLRVKLASGAELGIRFPLGLEYVFYTAPVGLFLELVPIYGVMSDHLSVYSAIGFRYYFSGSGQ
jgi:hypothetical protein